MDGYVAGRDYAGPRIAEAAASTILQYLRSDCLYARRYCRDQQGRHEHYCPLLSHRCYSYHHHYPGDWHWKAKDPPGTFAAERRQLQLRQTWLQDSSRQQTGQRGAPRRVLEQAAKRVRWWAGVVVTKSGEY
ncbi:hypothetical protein CFO_g3267 [Ceratocystis platani]|uniref:Uncharacterized protein n=1 Tax=Ceratocystis fimbriata f. sp. platani TaxID=88771 RepID=A0A0F8BPA3_CERFI|nr:hypothetical protein CFO_g3267 [Ceratocystis platani]